MKEAQLLYVIALLEEIAFNTGYRSQDKPTYLKEVQKHANLANWETSSLSTAINKGKAWRRDSSREPSQVGKAQR